MLTLRRRTGESLYLEIDGLAEPIRIRLDQVKDWNSARLSVDAPRELVRVYRRREWCAKKE